MRSSLQEPAADLRHPQAPRPPLPVRYLLSLVHVRSLTLICFAKNGTFSYIVLLMRGTPRCPFAAGTYAGPSSGISVATQNPGISWLTDGTPFTSMRRCPVDDDLILGIACRRFLRQGRLHGRVGRVCLHRGLRLARLQVDHRTTISPCSPCSCLQTTMSLVFFSESALSFLEAGMLVNHTSELLPFRHEKCFCDRLSLNIDSRVVQ